MMMMINIHVVQYDSADMHSAVVQEKSIFVIFRSPAHSNKQLVDDNDELKLFHKTSCLPH